MSVSFSSPSKELFTYANNNEKQLPRDGALCAGRVGAGPGTSPSAAPGRPQARTRGRLAFNTHAFSQNGYLFAHNGVVGHLDRIEARLGANWDMVMGDTDSERFFAPITLRIREADGDVRAGITAAVREVVAEYERYSLNFLLWAIGHIWALRYPEHNPLHLHRRRRGAPSGVAQLDQADARARCGCTPTSERFGPYARGAIGAARRKGSGQARGGPIVSV